MAMSETETQSGGITILPDWTSDIDGAPDLIRGGGMKYIDGKPHHHAPVYQIKGYGSDADTFKAYRWGYVCPECCQGYASFLEAVLNIIRKKDEQPPQVEGQDPIIFKNAEKAEDYIIAYVYFPENLNENGCYEGMRRVEYYNNGGPHKWNELQDCTYEVFFYVEGTFKGFPDWDNDENFKYIGPE